MRSPLVSIKIEISNFLKNYLIKKYNITAKFSDGNPILIDHKFHLNRFFNRNDYCTVTNCELRIVKPRKFKLYLDKKLKLKEYCFKSLLNIKFVVEDNKLNY